MTVALSRISMGPIASSNALFNTVQVRLLESKKKIAIQSIDRRRSVLDVILIPFLIYSPINSKLWIESSYQAFDASSFGLENSWIIS